MKLKFISALALAFLVCELSLAMTAETMRVVVWKRGESISGEDFTPMNEAIVDYLATLPRPTDPLKGFKYNCQVKARLTQPSFHDQGATSPSVWGYTNVIAVYELKDCVADGMISLQQK